MSRFREVGGKTISLIRSSDNAVIATDLTHTGTFFSTAHNIYFNDAPLEPSTSYHILIEPGTYKDPFGNEFGGITDAGSWSFTTLEDDETGPTPLSFFPSEPEVIEPVTTNFSVFFDESVRIVGCKSISLFKFDDNSLIAQITTNDGSFLSTSQGFSFGSVLLEPATKYYINIEEGTFVDFFGNPSAAITDTQTWTFITSEAVSSAPDITQLNPENGATDVEVNRSFFVINFERSVRDRANGSIKIVKTSSGEVIKEITTFEGSFYSFSRDFYFDNALFEPSTDYHILIEEAYEDIFGNPVIVEDPSVWTFRTRDADAEPPLINVFITSDANFRVSLVENFFSIELDEIVKMNSGFTVDLKRSSDDVLIEQTTTSETGFNQYQNLNFNDLMLEPSTDYYITLPSGLFEDPFGNVSGAVEDKSTLSFTTVSIESEPPIVDFLIPSNNSKGVDVAANSYTIFFNEDIKPVNGKTVSIIRKSDGSIVSQIPLMAQDFYSTSLNINFESIRLDASTEYYITIDAGAVVDIFGNEFAGITDPNRWSFTTRCGLTGSPVISSLDPVNGSTEVLATGRNYQIFFDRSVVSVANKSVKVVNSEDGNVVIDRALTDSDFFSFGHTILHSINLRSSTKYHITIEQGAFVDGFGNEFAGITTSDIWSFTTDAITGISELTEKSYLLYPVPTSNVIALTMENGLTNAVEIIDLEGRSVFQQVFNTSNYIELNVSTLADGIYVLRFNDLVSGVLHSEQIIINK